MFPYSWDLSPRVRRSFGSAPLLRQIFSSLKVGLSSNSASDILNFRMDELVRRRLATLKDSREVIPDPKALYSGAKISERILVPGNNARLGGTRFETWLTQAA